MTIHPVPVRAVPKSELTPDELESLRLRHVHLQMRYRCYRKANKNYKNYGGRGIRVCERWLGKQGFFNFCKDMGDRPKGFTLERLDVNGPYDPDNCCWVSPKQQQQNTRRTVNVCGMCVSEAARRTGLRKQLISKRLAKGWSEEDA